MCAYKEDLGAAFQVMFLKLDIFGPFHPTFLQKVWNTVGRGCCGSDQIIQSQKLKDMTKSSIVYLCLWIKVQTIPFFVPTMKLILSLRTVLKT